jgi:hypothetical protein
MTNGKTDDATSTANQKTKETVATTERNTDDKIATMTSGKPEEVVNTKDLKRQNPHEDIDIVVKHDESD